MGIFKNAFNALVRLHGKPVHLKRLSTPAIYSACVAAPSNFFRYTSGPSETVVTGAEYVISIGSIYGQQQIDVEIDAAPTAGTWTISFELNGVLVTTVPIAFDADEIDIQSAVRAIPGCADVVVSGDLEFEEFTLQAIGVKSMQNISVDLTGLTGTAAVSYTYSGIAWPTPNVKRGDRLVTADKTLTIAEVIEMPDLGGDIIGYRVRTE